MHRTKVTQKSRTRSDPVERADEPDERAAHPGPVPGLAINVLAPSIAGSMTSDGAAGGVVASLRRQADRLGPLDLIQRSPETAALAKAGKKAPAAVLPEIDDDKLYNIAFDLYKGTTTKKYKGDGTTADAIRYELANPGKKTKGKGHIQKGEEYVAALLKWINGKLGQNATQRDYAFANYLADDLEAALDGD